MIRSHGTKLNILVNKLHSGTSKTKAGQGGLVRVALFWKSHCATCSPVYLILYHVTGSCKGPNVIDQNDNFGFGFPNLNGNHTM